MKEYAPLQARFGIARCSGKNQHSVKASLKDIGFSKML
jgi:hypothetical protein